jgi:hypothetical protein
MVRSLVSCAALAAALTLGVPAAQAQTRQYDGYCYVRSDDMNANTSADPDGVTRSAAPCMNGEYYAYTDAYRAAPRAPDGYQVEYFTQRPSHDIYSRVYNASTLTANFDPGASNHFGAGDSGGYAYNQDTGDDGPQYAAQPQYSPQSNSPQDGARPYIPGYDPERYQSYDPQPGAVDDPNRVAGWRDDRGRWHVGQPEAIGWRDENGRWHVGQLAAYGWQDDQGQWHEEAPQQPPISNGY